jgi:serine/threonine protein kinase
LLGKGAQASVYLAKRVGEVDETFFAVKVFEKQKDLVAEVQHVMSLHHENILNIIEHQADGQLLLPNRTSC